MIVTINTILNDLCVRLQCNQKIVANYISVNESTLSKNLNKAIREVQSKKAGRRLISLYLVAHHLSEKGISAMVIKESLNQFVLEDLDGRFDSVISAMMVDKYETPVLIKIAELGLEQYNRKVASRDELYPAVKQILDSLRQSRVYRQKGSPLIAQIRDSNA